MLAEPALSGTGIADEQQGPIGCERDDRALDDRGVAEELAGDLDLLLLAVDCRVEGLAAEDVGGDCPGREFPIRRARLAIGFGENLEFVGKFRFPV